MNHGELAAIWIKRFKRGPMDPVPAATLVAGKGLVGNANQGGRRQVTLIEEEAWETMMSELHGSIDPSSRRANLMLRNFPLRDSRGRELFVGECRIRIFGETRPCELMDEALAGLRAAMQPEWRGGAFGEVLNDAEIKLGDEVRWAEPGS
jgi:MOSC domain-containing protein YiiM